MWSSKTSSSTCLQPAHVWMYPGRSSQQAVGTACLRLRPSSSTPAPTGQEEGPGTCGGPSSSYRPGRACGHRLAAAVPALQCPGQGGTGPACAGALLTPHRQLLVAFGQALQHGGCHLHSCYCLLSQAYLFDLHRPCVQLMTERQAEGGELLQGVGEQPAFMFVVRQGSVRITNAGAPGGARCWESTCSSNATAVVSGKHTMFSRFLCALLATPMPTMS
jgi:hypothetical protein